MPIKYVWVGDRVPHQKLCMWCQEAFQSTGYINDPSTGLNYCGPFCCETHRAVSEKYLSTRTKLEEMAGLTP